MIKQRQADIKAKGFNLTQDGVAYSRRENDWSEFSEDFAKLKVGIRTIDDAILDLGSFKRANRDYGDKDFVLNAMNKQDWETLREISKYFY